jgi:hypothetical protein
MCKKCQVIFYENPETREYFGNSCFCDILIINGNCENCLKWGDYCKCKIEYKFNSEEVMKALTCPISYNVFIDPVICSDGHTYERKYIEDWLEISNKSPMTGEIIFSRHLYPNHLVKSMLKNCKKSYS